MSSSATEKRTKKRRKRNPYRNRRERPTKAEQAGFALMARRVREHRLAVTDEQRHDNPAAPGRAEETT